jgi:chemotaxis protein CheX
MDASYIKPFIGSIQNVFSTMLQLPVTIKEPFVKTGSGTSYDVSGIIGMSGEVTGSVVLSFPQATAQRVVALFTGSDLSSNPTDFADAIGELVNMVSGGAKAGFAGKKVSISCPSVVIGASHVVARQTDAPTIVIPCETDCGHLAIEVTIGNALASKASPAVAAAAKA